MHSLKVPPPWLRTDEFQVYSLVRRLNEYLVSEVLPQLKLQEVRDKKEMIKIFAAAYKTNETKSTELYKEGFKRVFTMDLEFIMANRGILDLEPYADLMDAKMEACVSRLCVRPPASYHRFIKQVKIL